MRIGVDVRYLSHGLVGGIHTYLANFIPALAEAASGHQLFLYADTKRPFELNGLPEHVSVRLLPYRGPHSSVWIDLTLQRQMARDHLDAAHFTANYGFGPAGARKIITLHDEINILPWREIYRGHRKSARTVGLMAYLHLCSRASLKDTAALITVSEYSKSQIVRHSAFPAERVHVIPHACPAEVQRISDPRALEEACQRLELDRPFVLADAFKNPGVLVRAWQRLPAALRDGHEIVFFARSPEVLPVVHQAVESGAARLLVRRPRADLNALFSLCQVFVFPSWIEGFGLPLIEAMTCGAPVVASDRGSIPEVTGGAAWLMDAEDDERLAGHLTRLLEDPAQRETLRQLGFARAAEFSWARIARQALEVYGMDQG